VDDTDEGLSAMTNQRGREIGKEGFFEEKEEYKQSLQVPKIIKDDNQFL
jgi:hypothetical protein